MLRTADTNASVSESIIFFFQLRVMLVVVGGAVFFGDFFRTVDLVDDIDTVILGILEILVGLVVS